MLKMGIIFGEMLKPSHVRIPVAPVKTGIERF